MKPAKNLISLNINLPQFIRTKIKYIFFLIFFFNSFLKAQLVPDFIISNSGSQPSFDLDENSNMHIVWSDVGNIKYTVFDTLGNNIKAEHTITADGSTPKIKIKGNNAIITWRLISQTFNTYIYAIAFDIRDNIVNTEPILINDVYFDAVRFTPDITFLNDSLLVIVWYGDGPDTPDWGVYGQILTPALEKMGKNILISDNGGTDVYYGEPKVLGFPNKDDFVVVWRDDHTDKARVYGRIYNSNGMPVDSSFLISKDTDIDDMYFLSTAMDSTGNFASVWGAEKDSVWEIQWRWFNEKGNSFGPSEIVTSNSIHSFSTIDIAIDKDGKGMIVWEKKVNNYHNLYAQRFSTDKNFLGNEFKLSPSADTNFQILPNIVMEEGKVFSVWRERSGANGIVAANIIDFYNPPSAIREINNIENPNSFYLFQNYPNPFNPNTQIEFYMRESGFAKLKIYNLLGREIKTLINGELNPGTHTVEWKGENENNETVGSGFYFYQLSVDGRSEIKKMLLIK